MKPSHIAKKVDNFELERAKLRINNTLEEALTDKIITDEEFADMNPDDKNPGEFYCNFKYINHTHP